MAYLTREEYKELTGAEAPNDFDKLELRAGAELESVTRFYYAHNPLLDDFVGRQFKKAIACQIDFYSEVGTTSSEKLNAKPDSVRIGNTTVSYNRTGSGAEQSKRSSALSQDALNLLRGTGLLYRGGVRYV